MKTPYFDVVFTVSADYYSTFVEGLLQTLFLCKLRERIYINLVHSEPLIKSPKFLSQELNIVTEPMSFEKNKHINSFLDYYISLSSSPEYAVLLRGWWGSGKSWYIKKYIAENGPENFLYVSLYGLSSYSEIEDSFFEQLHPILSSKGMKVAAKVLKGILKTTIKIDLDEAKKEEINISSGLPEFRLPDYLNQLDGKTLVFDDIERCALPIHQILGYINQYVETNGLKVILVANEDEIIKVDEEEGKSENAKRYLTIKEKLIGKSFDIEPDEAAALEHFITSIEDDECRSFLSNKKHVILVLFAIAGYRNLRHLKQSLLDFDRLFQLVSIDIIKHDDLMLHLLGLFLSISFEIKKGFIHEDDVADLFSFRHLITKDHENKTKAQVVRSKYPIFSTYGIHPISGKTLTELFKAGMVDSKRLNDELKDSNYLSEVKQPDWQKLYFFYSINDDDFAKISSDVQNEFISLTIDNPYIVIQIAGILVFLSANNLIEIDIDEIIRIGRANLESMKARDLLKLPDFKNFPDDHSHGLGYAGKGISQFDEFLKFAENIVQQSENEAMPNRGKELLRLLKKSTKAFKSKLDLAKDENWGYTNRPVFTFIDVKEFADVVVNLSNSDKIDLLSAFETRYDYSYNYNLGVEREWLQALADILNERKAKFNGRVSGYVFEKKFIPTISEIIERIPR